MAMLAKMSQNIFFLAGSGRVQTHRVSLWDAPVFAARENGPPSWCFLMLNMPLAPPGHSDLDLLEWAPNRQYLVGLCPAFVNVW